MIELGELEKRQEEFAKRHVRIVAVSNDDLAASKKTQAQFPHLMVISDADQKVASTLQLLHPGAGQHFSDTNAPTTILVDGAGTVRWLFRPDRFMERLTPDELLKAIDENLARG